jgi:phage baseplate assembly protein gpV
MSNPFLEMSLRLAALERRVAGMVRHAPVEEVNPAEGWVRLNLGEGNDGPMLSPKVPYAQMAGALKVHAPPSKGQQMTYLAPGGDPRQAVALPMTWSDKNASPSKAGDENVLTFGSVTIAIKGDSLTVSVGGTVFEISSGGIRAVADDYQWD